jgi:hypothetical protein
MAQRCHGVLLQVCRRQRREHVLLQCLRGRERSPSRVRVRRESGYGASISNNERRRLLLARYTLNPQPYSISPTP